MQDHAAAQIIFTIRSGLKSKEYLQQIFLTITLQIDIWHFQF